MPSSLPLPPKVRAARAYARRLVRAADAIDYSQTKSRPMTLPGPHSLPSYLDCSSAVTTIFEAAGFGDPNGRHYDGQGYTGTLVARGRKVSTAKIQPFP